MKTENKLYIGTNYHPHDWSPSRWKTDLDLMQKANFTFIRLGHLCWDSFEETEGVFTFEWMDEVLDLCYERGIQVFMDIPTRPAPSWLHKKFPSIDIVSEDGIRIKPVRRYMEDIGDPNFQKYACRLTEQIVSRYSSHPSIIAFGLCNELGSGYQSYSETARLRFAEWLKEKYVTLDKLNDAWAGKRWSRKVTSFDDVEFPVSSYSKGAPERFLDMKRFYSDEILSYLETLRNVIKSIAPDVVISTNHWAENPNVGFDYQKNYLQVMDYPGQGFYPGTNPELEDGFLGACFCSDHRCGELNRPIWDLEFQTGGFGDYSCPPEAMRMYTYLSYIYRAQVICAWTYRSMLAGEEQYVYGLVDHDGTPGFKFKEFSRIAAEAEILNKINILPRQTAPSVAIAYSYESNLISTYATDYYTTSYMTQVMNAYKTLFHKNLDCNIVDLRKIYGQYKVVIIPGHAIIDQDCRNTIETLLEAGTTVIMTAFSAKVNENNQVFDTPLPGNLNDIFGISVRGFTRPRTHVPKENAGSLDKEVHNILRNKVTINYQNSDFDCDIDYYEWIEPVTATPIAVYSNSNSAYSTAISSNSYLKGNAIYVGIPANEELLSKLLDTILDESKREHPNDIPAGIVTRRLNDSTQIFVNTTPFTKTIPIGKKMISLLTNRSYESTMVLKEYDVEILCDII